MSTTPPATLSPIPVGSVTDRFIAILDDMKRVLPAGDRTELSLCMGNLQAMLDWFQSAYDLELCGEQIEAAYDRYDEAFADGTIV